MKILYFSQAARLSGTREEVWECSGKMTADEFWSRLITRYPALAAIRPHTRLARNQAFLQPGEPIEPDDEIALIPPVSGG